MYAALISIPTFLLLSLLYLVHDLASRSQQFLPLHRLTSPFPSSSPPPNSKPWNISISLSGVTLSLWTTGLNVLPQRLLNTLSYRSSTRLRRTLDISVLFAFIGCLIALCLAGWSTIKVWQEVWREAQQHAGQVEDVGEVIVETVTVLANGAQEGAQVVQVGKFEKRAMDVAAAAATIDVSPNRQTAMSTGVNLEPLIPGVTVPLSHAPTLVLAFALNQLLHELGHAISAALDDVHPSRFSLNLHFLLPSATVSFPNSVDTLSPNAKMRLAASGPVVNLWMWFFLSLIGVSGLGSVFWTDHGANGRVVEAVHWKSPLYDHLIPGDLITHVDDLFLGHPSSSSTSTSRAPDRWHSYLHSTEIGDADRGWCVLKSTFVDLPSVPCDQDQVNITSGDADSGPKRQRGEISFKSLGRSLIGEERCLSPHPILDIKSTACPCPDNKWVCVRPTETVLRLRVVRGGDEDGEEEVVLWRGPREEVARSIIVGSKAARGWNGGVRWVKLFIQYMSTISLSLYLFNLLPLPYTDGAQLLSALAEWHVQNTYSDGDNSGDRRKGAPIFQATIAGEDDVELGTGMSDRQEREDDSVTRNRDPATEFELDSEEEANYISVRGGIGGKRAGAAKGVRTNTTGTSNTDPDLGMQRRKKNRSRWTHYALVVVRWSTLVLCATWIGGWGMLLLLRSS